METSEIDGSYGLPRYIQTFTDELQQVLHDVGGKIISNGIKPASLQRYDHRLIQRVSINEEVSEGQKIIMITGIINVLALIHKRENQYNPRLDWFMFQKIYWMYSYIKKKEERNTSMLLTSMSEHEGSNKVNEELEDSCDNDDKNQPILQETIIPSYINALI